jgi:hypothetical protein
MTVGSDLPGQGRTCASTTKCAPVPPCTIRFSDSPTGALVPFPDGEHSFNEIEPRGVQSTEMQLYPRYNPQNLERNVNGEMPC